MHMKINLINYAKTYYADTARKGIPDQYAGKFIQIRKGPKEYLVFSPKGFTRFHAEILERFCMDRDIPGIYNSQKKSFDILDPAWVVEGGGKFEIDRKKKFLRLYDDSMAYGKFDRRRLKEKLLSIAEFSHYTVQIE
ncbi:MAG: hypothetical protein OEW69_09170 [Nitrospirota bacterium]|nr:hypothetical protein [Nitrospirota bacterium]